MRTVTFQSILHGVARLLGMSPSRDLNAERAGTLTEYVNNRLQEGWRFDFWPEWTLCEQRFYRPPYVSTGSVSPGDERYFLAAGNYYQALRAQSPATNAPATLSGETWTENSAYWAECQTGYSADDWTSGETLAVGDQRRNPADGYFYQCHTAHVTGLAFDATKFGLLTPFDKYIPYDGTSVAPTPGGSVLTGQSYRGTLALGNGVASGSVTGLALSYTPTLVKAWIQRAAGGLNLNVWALPASFAGDGFDFELDGATDGTGYTLVYEVYNDALHSTAAIGNGDSGGTVSGLGLGFTPAAVNAWVLRPSGGLNLQASVSDITSDGFTYELDAATDSADYLLAFEILAPGSVPVPAVIALTPIDEVKRVCQRNPRVFPRNPYELNFTPSDHGIQLTATAPAVVWVEFRQRPPVFTSTPYSASENVTAGTVRYYPSTGECYKALSAQSPAALAPTNTTYWRKVDFPAALAGWTKRAAFSDALRDQKQTDRALTEHDQAQDELEDALDRALAGQSQFDRATVQTYGA